ncbi:arginine repressor [Gardnerella vaginalis]|uniref:arginine repressor n=1 Tax=Gardnerella vaginalis TaxID=2702 RepID=UPI0039EF5418
MVNPKKDAEGKKGNEVVVKQQRPTTKAARINAIEQALLSEVITSQSQLAEVLALHGFKVTQATLSRDLDEMNAVKIRLTDGRIAYVLGDGTGNRHAMDTVRIDQQVARTLSGLVTEVGHANNIVVIHTPSGAAQYVASVIDRQPLKGILGSVAGDDTVIMVCASNEEAEDRANWMLTVASR